MDFSLRNKYLLLLTISTLMLAACASSPKLLPNETNSTKALVHTTTDVSHLSPDQRSQLYYSILLARLAEKKQFLDIAQSNYQDALGKTQSPQIAALSTKIALFQKDFIAAEKALDIWQTSSPDSSAPKRIALLIALHKSQYEKAYNNLLSLYPAEINSNVDADASYQVSASVLKNSFNDLLTLAFSKTLDQQGLEHQQLGLASLLERYNTENPQSFYGDATQTAEAYLHLNSRGPLTKLARIHLLLDRVIEKNPGFIAAINTKVKALSLISLEKSASYLKKILSHQALSKVQVSELANFAYRQKDYSSATIGFQRIVDSEPDNSEAQFLLAGSHFANKKYQQATDIFYQLAIDDYRKEASAFYCGDSAERNDDIIRSLSCFEMVPVSQYFLEARQRMATIYANKEMYRVGAESLQKAQDLVDFNQRQMLLKYEVNYLLEYEQYQLAKSRLESAIQLEPNNGTIYYLQLLLADKTLSQTGFLDKVYQLQQQAPNEYLRKEVTFSAVNILTQEKAYELIFAVLDKEVKAFPEDLDLLYSRALSNEPLKRYDRLEADLRYLLSIAPDNVNAQNALGYTLADTNKNLDEAKKLIESAYQAEPDNDAILDSMGWIQYRLGNLEQALKYIQLSYDKAPVPEIAAHLGEVLWQMGQTEKAIAVWKKALQQEPSNLYIRDTLLRFPKANLLP
ncbi:tetratricopeptide repeat protein [Kangiella sp. HZ709]|uniref:tetratricopeptide repeat protein n=1 Tax=Kangiella sp. HZ709 TaxID=2666328 RepID=UPI0012B140D3|nr:tetratricopeptide repeat protein [Kangiella sp. HZ709]